MVLERVHDPEVDSREYVVEVQDCKAVSIVLGLVAGHEDVPLVFVGVEVLDGHALVWVIRRGKVFRPVSGEQEFGLGPLLGGEPAVCTVGYRLIVEYGRSVFHVGSPYPEGAVLRERHRFLDLGSGIVSYHREEAYVYRNLVGLQPQHATACKGHHSGQGSKSENSFHFVFHVSGTHQSGQGLMGNMMSRLLDLVSSGHCVCSVNCKNVRICKRCTVVSAVYKCNSLTCSKVCKVNDESCIKRAVLEH